MAMLRQLEDGMMPLGHPMSPLFCGMKRVEVQKESVVKQPEGLFLQWTCTAHVAWPELFKKGWDWMLHPLDVI
jgi:hypothetical protein